MVYNHRNTFVCVSVFKFHVIQPEEKSLDMHLKVKISMRLFDNTHSLSFSLCSADRGNDFPPASNHRGQTPSLTSHRRAIVCASSSIWCFLLVTASICVYICHSLLISDRPATKMRYHTHTENTTYQPSS